jgi:hypothetical protein
MGVPPPTYVSENWIINAYTQAAFGIFYLTLEAAADNFLTGNAYKY